MFFPLFHFPHLLVISFSIQGAAASIIKETIEDSGQSLASGFTENGDAPWASSATILQKLAVSAISPLIVIIEDAQASPKPSSKKLAEDAFIFITFVVAIVATVASAGAAAESLVAAEALVETAEFADVAATTVSGTADFTASAVDIGGETAADGEIALTDGTTTATKTFSTIKVFAQTAGQVAVNLGGKVLTVVAEKGTEFVADLQSVEGVLNAVDVVSNIVSLSLKWSDNNPFDPQHPGESIAAATFQLISVFTDDFGNITTQLAVNVIAIAIDPKKRSSPAEWFSGLLVDGLFDGLQRDIVRDVSREFMDGPSTPQQGEKLTESQMTAFATGSGPYLSMKYQTDQKLNFWHSAIAPYSSKATSAYATVNILAEFAPASMLTNNPVLVDPVTGGLTGYNCCRS